MQEIIGKKLSIKDKIFSHLETWRLYTVIWSGLVSLAGSCIAHGYFPPLHIAFLVFIIPMMGWIAGLYLSDFLDKKLDRIEKPHRPIPSGRIHPYEALFIGAVFAGTGFALSFYLGIYNLVLVFVVALLVLGYAKFSKSRGILGNINRGLVTAAAFLYGVFSAEQPIDVIPVHIWILSLVFLVHDTNSNLIGAIRDMEGDKKGEYVTIPVKYGLKNSIFIALLLTFLWYMILIVITLYYNFLKVDFYYLLSVDILVIILMYIYLFNSIKDYSRKRALKFHEFFVIERIILASALIFGIVENSIAFIILIAALTFTILSQILLRKRYEFGDIK